MDVLDGQFIASEASVSDPYSKMLLLKTGDTQLRNRGSNPGGVVMTGGPMLSPTLQLLLKTAAALDSSRHRPL